MDRVPSPQSISGSLQGYSVLARLGHSRERLEELAPGVTSLLNRLATHWEIDVSSIEMAVTFEVKDVRGHE